MNLPKRRIVSLVVVNCILLAFGVFKFFYFHQAIFNVYAPPQPRYTQGMILLFLIIPGALMIYLYVWLFGLLKYFNEPKWLRSGIYVYFIGKMVTFIAPLLIFFDERLHRNGLYVMDMVRLFVNVSILYVHLTLLMVRHPMIRKYYRAFALAMIATELSIVAFPKLYESYDFFWLSINPEVLLYASFCFSLTLFVEAFNLSKQKPAKIDIDLV